MYERGCFSYEVLCIKNITNVCFTAGYLFLYFRSGKEKVRINVKEI